MLQNPITELDGPGDEEMAEKLATAIQDYIKGQAIAVKQLADVQNVAFTKKVDDETTHYDQVLTESDPNDIVGTPEKFAAFVKQRDHVFRGPLSINDTQEWAKIANQAQDVAGLSSLTTSQDGQAILLKRVFDSPEYTMAHLKHDLRTLQLHPPTPVQEADTLVAELAVIVATAKKYADQAKSGTDDTRKKTIDTVSGKFEQFKQGILSNLNSILTSRHATAAKVTSELASASLSKDILDLLGMRIGILAVSKESIYTLQLNDYLTVPADPTRMDVSSPAQFDTAESYSKLLNQENLFLPLGFKGQALSVNQMPVVSFDSGRMERDRRLAESSYNTAYTTEKIHMQSSEGKDRDYTVQQLRLEIMDVSEHPFMVRTDPGAPPDEVNRVIIAHQTFISRAHQAIHAKLVELSARYQITRTIGEV